MQFCFTWNVKSKSYELAERNNHLWALIGRGVSIAGMAD